MNCSWCQQLIRADIFFAFDRSFCCEKHRENYASKNKKELVDYPTYDNRSENQNMIESFLNFNIRPRKSNIKNESTTNETKLLSTIPESNIIAQPKNSPKKSIIKKRDSFEEEASCSCCF
ncbi:hypothetical protein CPAV1605_1291 [seawater metagenome]|uniref:Uncharacterized protein n=1 Tax=seawater metagenome TaxID=1561972 RepID=A0A5E8CMI4_9ZZZZ